MNIPATSASPLAPSLHLTAVIRALQGLVGGWHLRGLLGQGLMFLLHRRLSEICAGMERLAARFEAGKLWRAPRPVAVEKVVAEVKAGPAAGAARVWPGQFAWLVRRAGWEAVAYGSQLRFILEQPDMVALLAASPQARRILRPLCRMLAVETSLLRPRLEGAVVEVLPERGDVVVPKRVRRPREPVDWGRIPLPRGVLSAARRQGFGKLR